MEILYEEKEWHHINLSQFAGVRKNTAAGDDFYRNFYQTLLQSDTTLAIPQGWLEQKRKTADWIETEFLAPIKKESGPDIRILSLGAGLGIIEERWLEKGYRVDLQECQSISLERLKQH